jgi:Zn-dependent M28 family amino/carboxypeptidase
MRLLFIVAVLCCSPVQGQTVAELRDHVEYLASDDLGGRHPASPGMKKAKAYVRGQCKEFGLTVYTQDVRVRNGTCQNVIAVLPGRDESQRIVIGAHLDHIGTRRGRVNNGADDNASGSACVLVLAKKLAGTTPPVTIEFHWYTGEEQGLLGSANYIKRPIGDIIEYKLMLNFDMVGRMPVPSLTGGDSFPFDSVLQTLYTKHDFAEDITWARDTGDSDHSSWWKAGVPAVFLHTGGHADYHRPTDDTDKINFIGMLGVCKYGFDLVMGVSKKLSPSVIPDEPVVLY